MRSNKSENIYIIVCCIMKMRIIYRKKYVYFDNESTKRETNKLYRLRYARHRTLREADSYTTHSRGCLTAEAKHEMKSGSAISTINIEYQQPIPIILWRNERRRTWNVMWRRRRIQKRKRAWRSAPNSLVHDMLVRWPLKIYQCKEVIVVTKAEARSRGLAYRESW